ncbi:MAG: SNF2-related protein [Desulfoplanes sp.]|nr:SNF2-related protein [Desulfoplanes sp.]
MLHPPKKQNGTLTPAITEYHAKYYAYELCRAGGSGVDRLGRALFDACVDLNPHQIEAALFALRSPLSKGALLADEVGLGKTIEAGLVLCQYWAERRRSLLVICPASLRKQWEQELAEKFNLPSIVLDAKTFRNLQKSGNPNPFRDNRVIICSMHYASNKAEEVKQIPWDLVIIDEAHKLRNAYRPSNRIGQNISWATQGCQTILLTATPLQNSLLELYGLSTLIDDRLFGDLPAFRSQFANQHGDLSALKDRLSLFCLRTLRSQVTEFVRYTERKLITRPFNPTEQEFRLYEDVSNYLKRDDTYAFPARHKHLLILLARKVLASSPHALAGTLEVMRDRLTKMRCDSAPAPSGDEGYPLDILDNDILEEILSDEEDCLREDTEQATPVDTIDSDIEQEKLEAEIQELEEYIYRARTLGVDTKTKTLLKALEIGFQRMEEMGAARKVVVFTESKRTQSWLKEFLEGNGYANRVLTFNGTNRDTTAGKIYKEWLANNKHSGKISGSRPIDIRTAIIDRFASDADILIATEAGAEGINLQFCSAVVNYDLPWNPQRIEQRIGRCHRYGQKHDVVVINFLNQKNKADLRVHELLDQKFRLFSGVFGASDDVLGSIESGVDFERRILAIYQECRSEEDIQDEFQRLQAELDDSIQARMRDTRKLLLEHFDEEVHDRLKVNMAGTKERLDIIGRLFWSISHYVLKDHARFNDQDVSFQLESSPVPKVTPGYYSLISKDQPSRSGQFLYRLNHPLGEYVLEKSKGYTCPPAEILFDISNHPLRISVVEQMKGKAGWLLLQRLRIESFDADEYLLFSAIDDLGNNLDQETCEKIFHCTGCFAGTTSVPEAVNTRLTTDGGRHVKATIARNLETNNRYFNEARDQLDAWAEDMEMVAQKELDDTKRQIRDLQRQSRQAPTLKEQHGFQEEIAKLERKKRALRERIFDVEDEIAEKREQLVEALEQRMEQKTTVTPMFTIRWKIV